jgi:nucleoside-diphosphate-sugar epimerase
MKTIFITGANGFIGKNLSEQMEDKYKLLTPGRKELDLLDTNAVDKFFKKNNVDVVINCAVVGGSRTEEHVYPSLSQNLRIFFNLLRNKDKYKQMIHLGSGAEYDKSRPLVKINETDFGESIPKDEYGFFKYICSKYLEKEKNIICVRIFGLFGKYEDYRLRFISNAIMNSLHASPIVMDQNVYFDYVYINDFVKIIKYFIDHKAKQNFYNIGSGNRVDLLTLAKIINDVAEKKSKIVVKNKGLNNEYSCDNSRLTREINKLQFTDIRESVKELYKWYRKHESTLVWKKN